MVLFYFGMAILIAGCGYLAGRSDIKVELKKAYADLVTERAVRHNLNCLVGDLKHENRRLDKLLHDSNVKVLEFQINRDRNKADAAAWNQSKGLWCTDQPNIIRHHAKRELFFRLGYPEHKL